MNHQEYLEKMRKIQENLVKYIEENNNCEENFENLVDLLNDNNILTIKFELKSFLRMFTKISNNFSRDEQFFDKIDKVIGICKDHIKVYFSNFEIFNIFKSNKRILLFLIKESILTVNLQIAKVIASEKYSQRQYLEYFRPEISPFLDQIKLKHEKKHEQFYNRNDEFKVMSDGDYVEPESDANWNSEIDEHDYIDSIVISKNPQESDFDEKRMKGVNDDFLCQLIQKDNIDEFITFVNKFDYSLNSEIKKSIFETNSYLLKKTAFNKSITLIEYAAFYGSIQIFKYLHLNGVKLSSTIWNFAIHSNSPELIHFIEESLSNTSDYEGYLKESIKCHHNDIANYLLNNYLGDEEINVKLVSLKYHNYAFIQSDYINDIDVCKYDYPVLFQQIINNDYCDVNNCEVNVLKREHKGESENVEYETTIVKTVLNIAIEKGNSEIVELFLTSKSLDVNRPNTEKSTHTNEEYKKEKEETPLNIAIEKGYVDIVKYLLKSKNLDINLPNTKHFYFAHCTGYGDTQKIREQTEEEKALNIAIENENIEIVQLLLSNKKLDINAPSIKKFTKDFDDTYKSNDWSNNFKHTETILSFFFFIEHH